MFQAPLDNKNLCAAVVQDVFEIIGEQPEVHRHRHSADLRSAEVSFDHPMAILRQDSNAITLLDAQCSHCICVPPGPLAELVVGEPVTPTDNGFLVAVDSERPL